MARLNQQQDLDQDTNSTLQTLKLKDAKARLMGWTQENSKLRVDVNLTVYLKLWLPLDENKGGERS